MTTGSVVFLRDGGRTWRSATGSGSAVASSTKPVPGAYHLKRLFLWMPRRMWKVDFHCPRCGPNPPPEVQGVYNRVCLVLDTKDFYYLAGEYIECGCGGTFISWDRCLLAQLTDGARTLFPAVLTRKYTCDRAVVAMMRPRTLGKSLFKMRI